MPNTAALAIALVALAASGAATATEATFGPLSPKPSGVDKEGSWHVGENLRVGDYFSYDLCHIGYDDCTEFNMQIWFKVREQAGDRTRWLAEAVVTDGGRVSVGNVTLADQVFEPGSTDPEMRKYGKAFGRSVSFLSYFMPSVGDGEGWNFTDVWGSALENFAGFWWRQAAWRMSPFRPARGRTPSWCRCLAASRTARRGSPTDSRSR